MTRVLLDTNAVSEIVRLLPNPIVAQYAGSNEVWVSVMTIHELRFALTTIPAGQRRSRLATLLSQLRANYLSRILPITESEADRAATILAAAQASGRALHLTDALIAATAAVHGLVLASRNVRDFEVVGVFAVDPWQLS